MYIERLTVHMTQFKLLFVSFNVTVCKILSWQVLNEQLRKDIDIFFELFSSQNYYLIKELEII